jgi:hypothetical protein
MRCHTTAGHHARACVPQAERPMRRRIAPFWLVAKPLVVAAALIACTEGEPRGLGGESGTARLLRWADPNPGLMLPATTTAGDLNFGDISGVARLSSGELAVLDRAGPEIRFFSSDGKFLRAIGRAGDGPGEFRAPTWIGNCGHDTLHVFNLVQRRISVRNPDGEFARDYPVPTSVLGIACNSDGKVVTLAMGGDAGMPSSTAPLDSSALTLVGSTEGFGKSIKVPIGWNRPMGQMTWIAAYSQGIVVARGDSAFLELRRFDGDVIRRVPFGRVGPPPTPSLYAHNIDRTLIRYLSDPEERKRPREILMKVPPLEFTSAYRGVVVDPDDVIWVTTSPWGAGVTVIEGVAANGNPVGSLRFPGELEVVAVGLDYVLGIAEDPDGAQRVVVVRLDRGGTQ